MFAKKNGKFRFWILSLVALLLGSPCSFAKNLPLDQEQSRGEAKAVEFGTNSRDVASQSFHSVAEEQNSNSKSEPKIRLADLRPALQGDNERIDFFSHFSLEPSQAERLYPEQLTRSLRDKYNSDLVPALSKIESPYRYAHLSDRQRYYEVNHGLAQWTAREVVNEKIKSIFNGADKDAAPIRVANQARFLLGGEIGGGTKENEEQQPRPIKAKSENVAARVELPSEAAAIATTLKYKMNLIQGRGEIRFTNPVVTTSVNVNVRHKNKEGLEQSLDTSDKVSAHMSKAINALRLQSSVSYAMNKKVVSVNLSQKITDKITCNLSSQSFTSNQRTPSGDRSAQAVNMVYNISF